MLFVESVELQPVLQGETLLLRPLRADDFEALYAAAADPLLWQQNPDPLRYQRSVYRKVFDKVLRLQGALVVIDKPTQAIIGTSSYYDWDPARREMAIGYTFLQRAYWGGHTNAEMKRLMLDHIFQWATLVWFHIAATNTRSRKALEKIGGTLAHYGPRDVNGVPVQYCFYTLTPDTFKRVG